MQTNNAAIALRNLRAITLIAGLSWAV